MRVAAQATGSISAASTLAAPAMAQAMAAKAAARREIQHAAAAGAGRMIQHVPRHRLAAGPGEGPERWLDIVLGEEASSPPRSA